MRASRPRASLPLPAGQDILDQAGHHLRALTALDERVTRACAAWEALEALLDERLGADAPSLSKVKDMLARMRQAVRSLLQGRDPRDEEQPAARPEPPADALAYASPLSATSMHAPMNEEPPAHSSQPFPQAAASGRIGSRAEAYHLLELAAAYLQREEPHSPTPYLVNRAVTWGRMPLPELMREVLREEGDLNRYFSMLGIGAEPDRTP